MSGLFKFFLRETVRAVSVPFVLMTVAVAVYAFSEPGAGPTGGTVNPPINTSATAQNKSGTLTIGPAGSIVLNASTNGITTSGTVQGNSVSGTTSVCIAGDCRTVWPSGGGGITSINSQTGPVITLSAGSGVVISNPSANNIQISSTGTGGVGGSGTTNYVSKWTGASSLGNSQIFDNGTNVGIGTASPGQKLEVAGGILLPNNTALSGKDASGGSLPLIQSGGDSSTLISINSGGAGFYSGGYKFFVNQAGNVGIGTTNPRLSLDVSGSFITNGNHYISTGGGTILVGDLGRVSSDGFSLSSLAGGIGWCVGCSGLGPAIAGVYNPDGVFAFQSQIGNPSNLMNRVRMGQLEIATHDSDPALAIKEELPYWVIRSMGMTSGSESSDWFMAFGNTDRSVGLANGKMWINLGGSGNTSITGNLNVTGSITGASKNFKIDDPLDPEHKYLFHSSLEGPEIAVFYRGEGELQNGQAVVTLPAYFEKLTRKENRTVLLTNIDGGDTLWVATQDGAQVKDGTFVVRSFNSGSSQKFNWEVKAVRADVAPLEVEVPKESK